MSPLHGYTVLANYNGVNRAGSVATYKCNTGYEMYADSDSDVCAEDGTWQGSTSGPRGCERVTCHSPPDVPNSHMELLNDTLTWGAVILYTCQYNPHSQVSRCQDDGSWSQVELVCLAEPSSDWVISPNIIAVIASVTAIVIIFVIFISIIFTRRRGLVSDRKRKLMRLRHNVDSNTRVNGHDISQTF